MSIMAVYNTIHNCKPCLGLHRSAAPQRPLCRAPATVCAVSKPSTRVLKESRSAAGVTLLDASQQQPPASLPAPAAGLYVQPQASAGDTQRQTETAEAAVAAYTLPTWDRAYVGSFPGVQEPPRRRAAAPATAVGQTGADPRLARITQQLIQCTAQEEMQAILQQEHQQGLSAADVRRLLTYLDRRGAADVALHAFHAMRAAALPWADDAVLRTKLIKMHSRRAKDTWAALRLYHEMKQDGIAPDLVAYNTCLTAAGRGHHWDQVLSVLDDMRAAGVGWDAFTCTALLSACTACGRWEQALRWFAEAQATPGLQLNVVHYTTLMSCLQKAGQWERSMKVFRQMEASGVVPDVVAHNAAIAACAKGGAWEAAWAVFLAMKQAGLQPSIVSYNALISACERCGQPDRALEVFEGMQRKGQPPNAVTFNTLISACAKAGRYAKAQELHEAMAAAGIPDDVFTLTALITGCERIGHWQGAEDHFLGFQARGVLPNTVAYNRLISALGRGGQWERALAAFHAMQAGAPGSSGGGGGGGGDGSSAGPPSSSSSSPSSGEGGRGAASLEEARAAYAGSAPAKPDRITYGSLMAALERGGQWQRALALLEEMQAAGIQPNGYIYSSLINACEKGGQWDRAVSLFKLMQGQDIPMDSMAMVARKALYAFPSLIRVMPAPLLQAARATVDSGRAARQWIEDSKKQRDEEGQG